MERHEPHRRPSEVIAQSYLDALGLFTDPTPEGPAAPRTVLHAELAATMRSVQPVLGQLSALLQALASGAPTEPATTVALEAIVALHLAGLRLVHHAEVILTNGPDPAARRVALSALALAPAVRVTAEHASQVMALEPRR